MVILSVLLIGLLLAIGGLWIWRRHFSHEPVPPAFARTESDNSAEAMYEQGMAYKRGDVLELDFKAARRLLRRAAQLHHARAQYEYGIMLERGLGGEQNPAKGLRWIEHAAKCGCIDARLMMGRRYLAGNGVKKSTRRAEHNLRGAAELGNAEAQMELGLLYRDSEPPLKNDVQAAEWISRAVSQRYPAAYFALSDMYERGIGVARSLKRADELLQQAADFGEAEAQLKLGRYYLTGAFGHSFPQNYRAALDWFQRAASHGLAEAEYEIGLRYELNEGVDAPDMSRAIASYLKAAQMGFAQAQYRLGQVYLYGQGVNQNLQEARRWFVTAAAQGHGAAARTVERLQGLVADRPDLAPPVSAAPDSGHGSESRG